MNARTATQTPATIGTPFEGGFYGGKINIDGTAHAIVWAPKAQGQSKGAWLPTYTALNGARSTCNSMANTQAMAEAGSSVAKWALGLTINGFADWCLPARDVLELGYRHLKPSDDENDCTFRDGDNPCSLPLGLMYTEADPAQTAVTEFQDGGPEAFDTHWYWSSTQCSDRTAFLQYFYYGDQHDDFKTYEARVRAVRLIQL